MTIDDIKAAIERRGYSVQVEHYPHSVNFRISAREKHMNCGYALVDLKHWKYSLSDFVNAMLFRFSGTMHHMWCKQCHEPLLRYTDQDLALKIYQTRPTPDVVLQVNDPRVVDAIVAHLRSGLPVSHRDVTILPGTNMDEAIEKASVYRSAKAGPDSPVLEHCGQCQQRLDNDSVEEIRDE